MAQNVEVEVKAGAPDTWALFQSAFSYAWWWEPCHSTNTHVPSRGAAGMHCQPSRYRSRRHVRSSLHPPLPSLPAAPHSARLRWRVVPSALRCFVY